MASDGGERTEQPTPSRLREAREQGQVARSQDLSAAILLLGALLALNALGPGLFDAMLNMTREIGMSYVITPSSLDAWAARIGARAIAAVVPFLLTLLVLAAIAHVGQTGLMYTPKKLVPDLQHLNPMKGLKRLFSTDSLMRTGMGLLKMAVVAAVAWSVISGSILSVLRSGGLEPLGVYYAATELMFMFALRLAVLLLVLGLIDYFYQRYRITEQLKMTKEEVRDEMKRMEGDPMIKARRRQVAQKLAMQRLQMDVPKADVVVTNPTEFAVALRYDEATMGAPRVIAKGTDLLALRIRQIAQQAGVPIVQRPPLARALYASTEVGDEVPPKYYRAVAEVLAYVYEITGRAVGAR
ncbi:MAG: flagellar biosynthesis protein FlhB [Phycisphaerales bacterium]|nr:flagellar biosynthesis protein FlhB [Phycisphaerales bacterium]